MVGKSTVYFPVWLIIPDSGSVDPPVKYPKGKEEEKLNEVVKILQNILTFPVKKFQQL